ncbi:hypothetical protein GCM10009837_58500 [Streptomyces durmitorensis]|uniref:Uncharacterized protein n=1 Tax=Streptomyces durmitorensis TaxID=319947 RepID=A0ABY4PSL3_9ACTN|nr:hypothetical protein [Streptomyces durmitorensis]UQT55938.1 hypothetical protein M4V62_12965 [Streptomyces durmitorensis]
MTTRTLPDPTTLSNLQLSEQSCALCGARLYRDRLLGKVTYRDHYGRKVKAELWACAPECEVPRR